MSITEIMESAMKWGCKLQLNLTWVEGRVRWRDLRDKTNLNIISQVGFGQDTGGQVGHTIQERIKTNRSELAGWTTEQAKYLGAS